MPAAATLTSTSPRPAAAPAARPAPNPRRRRAAAQPRPSSRRGRRPLARLIDLSAPWVNDSGHGPGRSLPEQARRSAGRACQAGPRPHVDRGAGSAHRSAEGRDRPRRSAHGSGRRPTVQPPKSCSRKHKRRTRGQAINSDMGARMKRRTFLNVRCLRGAFAASPPKFSCAKPVLPIGARLSAGSATA